MSLFDSLITPGQVSAIRTTIIGYAQAAGLLVTNWRIGGVSQQMFEAVVNTVFNYTSSAVQITRMFASLDTSTDPGDVDPAYPNNVNLTPGPGGLSNLGENTFGTTREGATYAAGTWTFDNTAGLVSRTFAPGDLVFTWTAVSPPSPAPTYRNAADQAVYTNPAGTVTVPAGSTLDIPVVAEVAGSGSSAPAGALTMTTVLAGVTGTNAAAVLGQDREDATLYRANCRLAPARVSLGGPAAAYTYFAQKNLDGTPLLNDATPAVPTSITRTQVTQDSATGIVNAYFASDSGGAIANDVSAANTNIEEQCFAVPDAITYTGIAATADALHVAGTFKLRTGYVAASVKAAIVATTGPLALYVKAAPIGGLDQTAGAGVIYTADLQAAAARTPGGYDFLVTTPAGATTALAVGHVATLNSVAGDWTAV